MSDVIPFCLQSFAVIFIGLYTRLQMPGFISE
jgi:hypothetical protein